MLASMYETGQFYNSGGRLDSVTVDPRVVRTRAKVLEAAWELLNEVGFDGVTVELVSRRSAVARSTLYRHWRSMPELLRDAFTAQAGRQPAREGPADGRGALVSYAQAFAVGLSETWGRAAMSLAASAVTNPAQRDVQRVFTDGTRRDLLQIVELGRATGELDPHSEPELLVDRLLDLVIAPQFYRYQFSNEPVTTQGAARLADFAWASLQLPQPAHERPVDPGQPPSGSQCVITGP